MFKCVVCSLHFVYQFCFLFRNTLLGPAPPPPVNNSNPTQKRTGRPSNRQQIIEWWQEVELPKGSGFEDDDVLPWFHGMFTSHACKTVQSNKLHKSTSYCIFFHVSLHPRNSPLTFPKCSKTILTNLAFDNVYNFTDWVFTSLNQFSFREFCPYSFAYSFNFDNDLLNKRKPILTHSDEKDSWTPT